MYFVPEPLSNCHFPQTNNKRLHKQISSRNLDSDIQITENSETVDNKDTANEIKTRIIMGNPTILPLKPADLNFEDGCDYVVVEIRAPSIAWLDRVDINYVLIETLDESLIYPLTRLRTIVRKHCNLNKRVKLIEKAVFNVFNHGLYSYTLIPISLIKNASESSVEETVQEVRPQKQYTQIRFHKKRNS